LRKFFLMEVGGHFANEVVREVPKELGPSEKAPGLVVARHFKRDLDPPKGFPGNPVQQAVAVGNDGRRPGAVVEEGELTDDRPGASSPGFDPGDQKLDGSLAEDVQVVSHVALLDDFVAGRHLKLFHGIDEHPDFQRIKVGQDKVVMSRDDGRQKFCFRGV